MALRDTAELLLDQLDDCYDEDDQLDLIEEYFRMYFCKGKSFAEQEAEEL
jgi:hypothetical protein